MCCFSVAAHRLLFIICTVLQNSVTDTYAGTITGERSPDFSVATEILPNFLRSQCQLLVVFLPWTMDVLQEAGLFPSLFFFFCISFALFSLASWFTLLASAAASIRKTCKSMFLSWRKLCPTFLSHFLLDTSSCLSFHYSNKLKTGPIISSLQNSFLFYALPFHWFDKSFVCQSGTCEPSFLYPALYPHSQLISETRSPCWGPGTVLGHGGKRWMRIDLSPWEAQSSGGHTPYCPLRNRSKSYDRRMLE